MPLQGELGSALYAAHMRFDPCHPYIDRILIGGHVTEHSCALYRDGHGIDQKISNTPKRACVSEFIPGWKGSRENACAAKTCGITQLRNSRGKEWSRVNVRDIRTKFLAVIHAFTRTFAPRLPFALHMQSHTRVFTRV